MYSHHNYNVSYKITDIKSKCMKNGTLFLQLRKNTTKNKINRIQNMVKVRYKTKITCYKLGELSNQAACSGETEVSSMPRDVVTCPQLEGHHLPC